MNIFIVFVKFLGWIVASWRGSKVLGGGNYKNYIYNKYKKEIGPGGGGVGGEPPPRFVPTTICLSFILKCEKMREFKMGREPQCSWCGGHSTNINVCRV